MGITYKVLQAVVAGNIHLHMYANETRFFIFFILTHLLTQYNPKSLYYNYFNIIGK